MNVLWKMTKVCFDNKRCLVCTSEITGRANKKFCSVKCREKHHRNLRCEGKHKPLKEYHSYDIRHRLLWAARRRAKVKNLDFNITIEDIIVPANCPYLGIKLVSTRPRGDSRRDIATLDRIDPTKGYIKGNIEVMSWLANTMKNNASTELLIKFAHEVLKRYG